MPNGTFYYMYSIEADVGCRCVYVGRGRVIALDFQLYFVFMADEFNYVSYIQVLAPFNTGSRSLAYYTTLRMQKRRFTPGSSDSKTYENKPK